MKVAGLFAGVGGIELGLEQAGLVTALLCESDARAAAVLNHRFPGVQVCPDVRGISRLPRGIDLITAGFPCQDLSQVGATAGIRGRKSGLVQHVFRILAANKTPWLLIENVPFLLRLDRGRGISYVIRNLERLGYNWAYRVIDTRSFGLPQRRKRVFLVASRVGDPRPVLFGDDFPVLVPGAGVSVANGFYWTEGNRGLGWAIDAIPAIKGGSGLGIPSAPAIWFPGGDFATPDIRDAERLQGLPAGWTRRAELSNRPGFRWTLVGNAVSVPVSRWIGERLLCPPPLSNLQEVEIARGELWPAAAYGGPRSGRHKVSIGPNPVARPPRHLHQFLRFDPHPLSCRAAGGFLSRLKRSTLLRRRDFEDALARYVRVHR